MIDNKCDCGKEIEDDNLNVCDDCYNSACEELDSK